MAGAGYKLFAAGDVLSASDVNTYMMQQTVMVFANASARTSALSTVLSEGMVSYLQDTNSLEVYDGSAWVGATGDITGLTAGTGVAITSATGPVPTVAIDTAVVPRLGVANTFTTSPQQIDAAPSNIGLIVRASATSPVNIQEWQSSAGSTLISITGAGNFNATGQVRVGTTSGLGQLSVISGGAATVGAVVRGAVSQTANLTEWQTSAGTATTVINSGGRIYSNQRMSIGFPVATPVVTAHSNFSNDTDAARIVALFRGASGQSANITEWQDSSSTVLSYINNTGGFVWGPTFTSFLSGVNGRAEIQPNAAGVVPLTVKGFASQTANLFEAQNNSATVVSNITATGRFGISIISNVANTGTYMDTGANTIRFEQRAAATVGIIVKGAVSMTASLQQWQNSAGTVIGGVAANGAGFFGTSGAFNASLSVAPTASTVSGIIVRGAVSQAVNLQEWQDSGGSVLASVSLGGGIRGANSGTLNTRVLISEANSGGQIRMTKQTAATTNPGADIGALYFRDGTTAGTLKLVVRAGASGAETTILDNIPQ